MTTPAESTVTVTRMPIAVLDYLKQLYRVDRVTSEEPSSASVMRWAAIDHAKACGFDPQAATGAESVQSGNAGETQP